MKKDKKIPKKYTEASLYIKNCFNDTGERVLVFYDISKATDNNRLGEIASFEFINFNSAYTFILKHKIKVGNIERGSYHKEIDKYNKEILNRGQILLF